MDSEQKGRALKRTAEKSEQTDNKKPELILEEGEIANTDEDELKYLKLALGVDSFSSTKNTHVEDNSNTAARGARAPRHRKATQYMNLKKKQKKKEEAQTENPTH